MYGVSPWPTNLPFPKKELMSWFGELLHSNVLGSWSVLANVSSKNPCLLSVLKPENLNSMNRCYTLIFLCISLAGKVFGQQQNPNTHLSFFFNIGLVTGDMLNSPMDITQCFECFPAEEILPKPGLRWSAGLEFRIGKRHHIGAGYLANKIKYTERIPDFWNPFGAYYYNDIAFKFRGALLQYRYTALTNNNFEFSPVVGIQYDKLIDDNLIWYYQLLREHNYSAYVKTDVALNVGKWMQFTIAPIFKIALRHYNKSDWYKKYQPFGYGVMLGWRLKLT